MTKVELLLAPKKSKTKFILWFHLDKVRVEIHIKDEYVWKQQYTATKQITEETVIHDILEEVFLKYLELKKIEDHFNKMLDNTGIIEFPEITGVETPIEEEEEKPENPEYS